MVNIYISDNSVFTYSPERLGIGIYYHREGKFKGSIVGPCSFITFETPEVLHMFKEQIDILLEKLEGKENVK